MGEDCNLGRSSVENPGSGQITVPRNLTSRVLQTWHDDLGHFENCQDFCLGQGEDCLAADVSEHRGMMQELLVMREEEKTQFLQEELHCNQSSLAALENW